MRPPFSFWSGQKRERAAPGVREKGALAATLHMRAKLLYGGRRIGASADLGLPPDTLGPSARSILLSRGGWCGGHRGARTHLTSSSFRAFRFATRCPVLAEAVALALAAAFINHRPAAAKIGAGCIPVLPRAGGFPKGRTFPSLTSTRERQPSPAGGRRSAPAQTDPPKRFFSLDRARPVSLLARPKEKWGVHCPAINIADSSVQWDAPQHPPAGYPHTRHSLCKRRSS